MRDSLNFEFRNATNQLDGRFVKRRLFDMMLNQFFHNLLPMVLYICRMQKLDVQWSSLFKRYVDTTPKLIEGFLWKCKKNIALIIVTSIEVGRVDFIRDSKCDINADFGVFCIVPSTWLKDNGTGVKGYLSTLAISIFFLYRQIKYAPKYISDKSSHNQFPISST